MGFRDRLKGKVKNALGMSVPQNANTAPVDSPTPKKADTKAVESDEGEDTPWYLKYDDLEGWDNTNAKDAVDED
tara:strand:- start:544 stop:765 length:222 start_codon:yes stop_codon:yes gene_type:complete